jgi:hypothetical protein
MWAGRFRFVVFVCVALISTGCSRAPLNPPRLVMSSSTDMTVQLFMQSTILLANYYGYDNIRYADIRARARRSNVTMIDFVIPEAIQATPGLSNFTNRYEDNPAELTEALRRIGGYKNLVKYYIRTGLRASQSVCRTYLLEIEEKNDFLEFLQKEIGVAAAVSTAVLALVQANSTLTTSFLIARTGIDGGIDAYQEYRYLKIDRDAARAVVEAAQNQLAQYFLDQVDKSAANQNLVTGGYTFSDALHAVSTIEYQCTRSGIRNLLTRSINNSPSNLIVDQETGNITFRTAVDAPVNPGDVVRPPAGGAGGTLGGADQGGLGNGGVGGGRGGKPKGGTSGGGQTDPGNGGTVTITALQACGQLPSNAATSQREICAVVSAGNTQPAFQAMLAGNPGLPSNTTLAKLILGTDAVSDKARKMMLGDPTMAISACDQLPNNATTNQTKICSVVRKGGNAQAAFQGMMAKNPGIPADTSLVGVILGKGGAFDTARQMMVADPGMAL